MNKLLFIALIPFTLLASDWSWQHSNTQNTEKYVLYELVGEIDAPVSIFDTEEIIQDDIEVASIDYVEGMEMKLSFIPKANTSYYLRAENWIGQSGNTNVVEVKDVPETPIQLNITININAEVIIQ